MNIFTKGIVTCQILLAVSCSSDKKDVNSNGSEQQGVSEAPVEVTPPAEGIPAIPDQTSAMQPASSDSQPSGDPAPVMPPPEAKVDSALSANGKLTFAAITEILTKSSFSKEDKLATMTSLENLVKVAQLKDKAALQAVAIDVLMKFAAGVENLRQFNNNNQMLPRRISRRQAQRINAQVMTAAETIDLDTILQIIYDQVKPM